MITKTAASVLDGQRRRAPRSGPAEERPGDVVRPEPGKADSVGPQERPLTDTCPVVVRDGDHPSARRRGVDRKADNGGVPQTLPFPTNLALSPTDTINRPRIDVPDDATGVNRRRKLIPSRRRVGGPVAVRRVEDGTEGERADRGAAWSRAALPGSGGCRPVVIPADGRAHGGGSASTRPASRGRQRQVRSNADARSSRDRRADLDPNDAVRRRGDPARELRHLDPTRSTVQPACARRADLVVVGCEGDVSLDVPALEKCRVAIPVAGPRPEVLDEFGAVGRGRVEHRGHNRAVGVGDDVLAPVSVVDADQPAEPARHAVGDVLGLDLVYTAIGSSCRYARDDLRQSSKMRSSCAAKTPIISEPV